MLSSLRSLRLCVKTFELFAKNSLTPFFLRVLCLLCVLCEKPFVPFVFAVPLREILSA